jgi:hypothetical protein
MISKALPTFQLDPAILYSHQYSTTMKIIRKTLQTNHENHVWFLRKQQAGIVVAMIAFVVARAAIHENNCISIRHYYIFSHDLLNNILCLLQFYCISLFVISEIVLITLCIMHRLILILLEDIIRQKVLADLLPQELDRSRNLLLKTEKSDCSF